MNVIFFGMGSIGQRHYNIMKKLYPEFNYYAFKREKQLNTEEIRNLYSWDEVESINADLAFICNPTNKHLEFAVECAKRKINLFIEKPLSNSMHKIDELLHYVNLYRLHVLVGYNLRYDPVIERIKDYIDCTSQKVLRFSAYCGSYLPEWRTCDYRETYSGQKELGGGVVLDLSHEIDYCKWIFGIPEKVVGCYGKYSMLELDVEDNLEVIFDYKDKAGAIHLDYHRISPRREVEVLTDHSILHGDLVNGILSVRTRSDQKIEDFGIDRNSTYEKQLIHLVNLFQGGKEPRCNLQDSITTLKLLLEIKGEIR